MKFLRTLALLLLVASAVMSVPTNDDILIDNIEEDDQSDEDTGSIQEASAEEEDEDVQAQFEHAEMTNQNNKCPIKQGDTIALQTYVRNRYLSCAGHLCDARPCPHMEMAGRDWIGCWGEVFRIYRQRGPGVVRNGDTVALYYPRESGRWLGCASLPCRKATCPGMPNPRYGFSHSSRWGPCWGEVFRIYTKNKGLGSIINSDDDVVLYYPQSRQFLSQEFNKQTQKSTCLGTTFPPKSGFDTCNKETFRIWKKID